MRQSVSAGKELPSQPNIARAPSILFGGRLEYWKGVQFALGAVARLREHIAGLSFTIAGGGPEEGYFRAIAAELGIAMRFVGRVPHAEMHRAICCTRRLRVSEPAQFWQHK